MTGAGAEMTDKFCDQGEGNRGRSGKKKKRLVRFICLKAYQLLMGYSMPKFV